ncbi:MAG: squalene synthase HpnD [Ectothiorhodospiraceae bacterium]|nr:squalene synthase HpnD [Ectothiorhodospiraceae bacterium]
MANNDIAKYITQNSGSNFSISFQLLPETKRDAINTVYAFCRCTDDIVDEDGDHSDKQQLLKRWAKELERGLCNESDYALLNKLNLIAKKFNIPVEHFFNLIRGMEMDLEKQRYETFDELYEYCYYVASTVGLMCSEIFGYTNKATLEYAVNLGIALQLTNIVRDVRSDAERNRIYIPHEDFERFGYTEEELLNCQYNGRFMQLMKFEVDRAREYYHAARNKLAREDHKAFVAARIMDKVYYTILNKIERKHYRVFDETISIPKIQKIAIALTEYFSTAPVRISPTA